MQDLNSLRKEIGIFFETNSQIEPILNTNVEKELELLKSTSYYEKFFFIVSLQEFKITQAFGIDKWLGYSNSEFTIEKFFKIIHPDASKIMHLISYKLFRTMCSGNVNIKENLYTKYVTLIPIKNRNGEYLNVKKVSSIYEFDSTNRLLSYANEFTIISPYRQTDTPILKPRITTTSGHRINDLEIKVSEILSSFLYSQKIYSAQEVRVLRFMAYSSHLNKTMIAHELGISQHTLDTYYKRILYKSRDFFSIEFKTAAEVAFFLKEQSFL